MSNELKIFEKLSWKDKIQYISWFYQGMIKKTNNTEYISKFQSKIDEVKSYVENEENISKLVNLYTRIIWAKEKTKEKRLEETRKIIESSKEKFTRIEADAEDDDPDEYLAEALTQC